MSITKYTENGEDLYKVYIVKKSQTVMGLKICRGAKGFTTLSAAKRKESSISRQAERDLIKREGKGVSWGTLVDDWEKAVLDEDIFTRRLALDSLSDYKFLLKKRTSDWNNLPVTKIDKSMAWRVLDEIEREISITRRKKLRTAIDAVFAWGFLSGRIKGTQFTPTEGFKSNLKPVENPPEILNLVEIKKLLQDAQTMDHEWYPIWALALLTGMRNGELYALTWNKVDLESRLIYLHENWTSKEGIGPTKGRYWRTIPISDHLMTFLKELKLKTRGGFQHEVWRWKDSKRREKVKFKPHNFVLPRFKEWNEGEQAKILRSFCEGIGITSIKFHTLRSCFATQMIKDGVAPAVIMKIAGWKDLKTMQRYVRLAGIDVKGATDNLQVLPDSEAMGRVVNLFSK